MLEWLTLLAVLLLILVALVFSPLGLGGGVLYVPIFHYMLDWSIEEAILGSLMLVFMVALGSSISHSKGGHADKDVATIGRVTAIPGAVIGTVLAWLLFRYVGDIVIKILAATILIFVIERTLARSRMEANGSVIGCEIAEKVGVYRIGTACAGIASGLLGIGGGAILVTLNRSLLGMDAHKAAGTSYLVGATIVPVALISHILLDGTVGGIIDSVGLTALIIVPLAVFLAAFVGAKFAIQHIPRRFVTMVFVSAVSLSLIRYLLDFAGIL